VHLDNVGLKMWGPLPNFLGAIVFFYIQARNLLAPSIDTGKTLPSDRK